MKSLLTMLLFATLASGCYHSTPGAPMCAQEPIPVDPSLWPDHDLAAFEGAWSVPLPTAADPNAAMPLVLADFAWTSDWYGFRLSTGNDGGCMSPASRELERSFDAQLSLANDPAEVIPFTFTDGGEGLADDTSWRADQELSVGDVPEVRAYLADLVAGDDYDVDGITDVWMLVRAIDDRVFVQLRVVHEHGEVMPLEAGFQLSLDAVRAP